MKTYTESEQIDKESYFKRLHEIRSGLREEERPPYAELQAWLISMNKPENIKGLLRRMGAISNHLGIDIETAISCVQYGHEVISAQDPMLRETGTANE